MDSSVEWSQRSCILPDRGVAGHWAMGNMLQIYFNPLATIGHFIMISPFSTRAAVLNALFGGLGRIQVQGDPGPESFWKLAMPLLVDLYYHRLLPSGSLIDRVKMWYLPTATLNVFLCYLQGAHGSSFKGEVQTNLTWYQISTQSSFSTLLYDIVVVL